MNRDLRLQTRQPQGARPRRCPFWQWSAPQAGSPTRDLTLPAGHVGPRVIFRKEGVFFSNVCFRSRYKLAADVGV